jgi:phosphoenolpyruvate synthase/pyruvate phosphate dikinase
MQNGFDHRKVRLAVVVQKMVIPRAAGILFTADPLTGNRKIVSVEAAPGVGEDLVSGLVNADVYKIRYGVIIDKIVRLGTPVLTDGEVLRLAGFGRIIEARFGRPQDIEWCLAGDVFWFVQSRPITTLFPVPLAADPGNHVYVSVGHQQMMTDAIRPLGISFWNLTAFRPMAVAGGRLFVDVTAELASPAKRGVLLSVLGKNDPLIRDALTTVLERGDFVVPLPHEPLGHKSGSLPFQTLQDYDVSVVDELVARSAAEVEELRLAIRDKSGAELIELILADVQRLKKTIGDPRSFGVIMTAMNAASWINEKMDEWLGLKNVADAISLSVPGNVTAEMGLALLDVADIIRQYPHVVEYLSRFGDLPADPDELEGGRESRDAIQAFLDKYGMRCAGEIDITRTRWSERPAMLVPLILGNVRNFAPGAGKRKFEQGLREASAMEQELLSRLRKLPDGEGKATRARRMIGLVRNLSGYREYPKYAMVSRYFIYKQALLREAERLVAAGVLDSKEEIYYLSFDELGEVLRTGSLDHSIVETRKEEYRLFERLSPPRVITSDGEIITGTYKREGLPAGAIPGLAVSSGVIEGRARVILDMEDAVLEEGDILVTRFTDPSWTPLFVSVKGLVTEVGGLMTHGAVIAREYGLPAVVGVEGATRLIKDGERIRVNGTEGYVELLEFP